jgi:hypothetical protein
MGEVGGHQSLLLLLLLLLLVLLNEDGLLQHLRVDGG